MKPIVAIHGAAAIAAPTLAIPQFALAQTNAQALSAECAAQRRSAGNKGTAIGGVLGAVLGSQVAAKGARTEGSVLGAAVGAVSGHYVAKRNARCTAYQPTRR